MSGQKKTGLPPVEPAGGADEGDLRAEIAVVRELMAGIWARMTAGEDEAAELPLKDQLKALDGLSLAAGRLAGLLKSQRLLGEDRGEVEAMSAMMQDLIRQLGR